MPTSTSRRAASWGAMLACLVLGCTGDSPDTRDVAWDEDACDGTKSGNACVTLRFSISNGVREDAEGGLAGILHWSLYKDGDVGGLGPGDAESVRDGDPEEVDFSVKGTKKFVHVPDLPARRYQILSYLDVDRNATDSSGDPVTLPSDGFDVAADRRTEIDVVFNFVE